MQEHYSFPSPSRRAITQEQAEKTPDAAPGDGDWRDARHRDRKRGRKRQRQRQRERERDRERETITENVRDFKMSEKRKVGRQN